uniref:Uncharacterized protein n=1 Tax=Megaselia scalaris TaxID=36166 RepID=T1G9W7_MEGSC
MFMNSMFPSLEPRFANHVFFELDPVNNEESEIQKFEKTQENWLHSISNLSMDLRPFGKLEPQQGQETDDEDVNDESEDETDDANEEEDMVLEPNDLQITYSPTTEMAANETNQS